MTPDELAQEIGTILTETAEKHLPRKRTANKPWITTETLMAIDTRKAIKQRKGITSYEYREANTHVKQLIKRDKKDQFEQKLNKIETLFTTKRHKEMHSEINDLTKEFRPKLNVIKDKNGNSLTEQEKIGQRWAEYCREMYDSPEILTSPITPNDEDELPPLRSEVEWAINQLPNEKSAGNDNINAEMIKVSGEPGVDIYHKLCLKIWKSEQWPEEWRKSVFVTIPKKGDLQQCCNYRTIALISHASKILLKIIMKRLGTTICNEVNDTQAGFRPNRGTRDQIMNLRSIIEKTRETDTDMYMCFIDYTKAFDCVSHQKLLNDLKQLNVHYKIINLVQNLYQKQTAAVRLENGMSEWFPIKRGVRQGCILSPSLFSIYTEMIMRDVEEDGHTSEYDSIKINGREINELRYADDTVLISKTPEGLDNILQSTKRHSEKKDLFLNPSKTKVMSTDKCTRTPSISVNNEELENVNNFTYLGAQINRDGKITPEIRRRLAIATAKINKLQKLWKSNSLKTKLRALKTTIFPVATYGCESWVITKADAKKINAFEMKCYRRILRISWCDRIKNEEVLERVNIKQCQLLSYIKKLKMSYFGHTKRHNTLERLCMEGVIEGRRTRGRPRRRWCEDIAEWSRLSTTEAGRLAHDRCKFRAMVWKATSTHDPP